MTGGPSDRFSLADGSGAHDAFADEEKTANEAEVALRRQDWAVARQLWQALACAVPQNKHYRAQLTFARAGELLAAGDEKKAHEECGRVLRLEPGHAGASAMMKLTTRGGRISRLLRW